MELLNLGGIPDAKNRLSDFPHQFSGGLRQRISIARTLALNPDFIVCDEPIAALDASIQAQVVNLLEQLQAQFSVTYLFISPDLSMMRHIAARVAVMYLGKMIELASSDALHGEPPYADTQALLSAVPIHGPALEENARESSCSAMCRIRPIPRRVALSARDAPSRWSRTIKSTS